MKTYMVRVNDAETSKETLRQNYKEIIEDISNKIKQVISSDQFVKKFLPTGNGAIGRYIVNYLRYKYANIAFAHDNNINLDNLEKNGLFEKLDDDLYSFIDINQSLHDELLKIAEKYSERNSYNPQNNAKFYVYSDFKNAFPKTTAKLTNLIKDINEYIDKTNKYRKDNPRLPQSIDDYLLRISGFISAINKARQSNNEENIPKQIQNIQNAITAIMKLDEDEHVKDKALSTVATWLNKHDIDLDKYNVLLLPKTIDIIKSINRKININDYLGCLVNCHINNHSVEYAIDLGFDNNLKQAEIQQIVQNIEDALKIFYNDVKIYDQNFHKFGLSGYELTLKTICEKVIDHKL